ncbi:Mo25-like-domain-containing protein [Gautieria morchelliformis]|nr:Mo25-like-domain-containing protein [Gautieria morchelliformis]
MARGSTFGLRASRRARGRGGPSSNQAGPARGDDGTQTKERFENVKVNDEVDEKLGFPRVWRPSVAFTASYCVFRLVETIIEEWLMKKYQGVICRISRQKEYLKFPNHLLRHRRLYLQLSFRNISDWLTVHRDILPLAQSNGKKMNAVDAYAEVVHAEATMRGQVEGDGMQKTRIIEGHSPYYLRVAIDNDIRVGWWYAVTFTAGLPSFTPLPYSIKRADPVVMAYDIETTKAPLKFPDQAVDQGFSSLILSEDIEDFEYTPKEGYEGPFTIFNEPDELNVGQIMFMILKEMLRHESLWKLLLWSDQFYAFPHYMGERTFGISCDAFANCKETLTRHKPMVAEYLEENYDRFFNSYTALLLSTNYVTKRPSLKLLGKILLDRANFNVMTRYISNETFLRAEAERLKANLKVFVANPKKPPQIDSTLRRNKYKLLAFLKDFHNDKEDEQFSVCIIFVSVPAQADGAMSHPG